MLRLKTDGLKEKWLDSEQLTDVGGLGMIVM